MRAEDEKTIMIAQQYRIQLLPQFKTLAFWDTRKAYFTLFQILLTIFVDLFGMKVNDSQIIYQRAPSGDQEPTIQNVCAVFEEVQGTILG